MGLGDVNGDGVTDQIAGNTISTAAPTVNLLPGSNQAAVEGDTSQEVVSYYTYNQFGQTTSTTDPAGNVDIYEYYPENDPDGDGFDIIPGRDPTTGGYLRQITRPGNIRNQFEYDDVGNVTRTVDGRGIATDYVLNELNEIVQITRAAAHDVFPPDVAEPDPLVDFAYRERIFYDHNGNVVLRQTEDRGNTSNVDGNLPSADIPATAPNPDPVGGPAFVDTVLEYDILDNQIEMLEEVAQGVAAQMVRTRDRYDLNENPVLTVLPEGNATRALFDERDLPFRTGRGALGPPPVVLQDPLDPTDYNVRGGLPCVCVTYQYDSNGNLVETSDADDTDLSTANNSKLGGYGDRTRYTYDGFDRRTSMVDSVGNQTVYQYDPAGNMVRTLRFGPVGGPSPTSDGPDGLSPPSIGGVIQAGDLVNSNLLEATEYQYDELNRLIQEDQVLFVNTIPTVRTPDVADGAADI
jgi:YD repeat-containing protein